MGAAETFNPLARLQTKDGICLYLGGISHSTYDAWQAKGIVPGPVAGTNRYDIRAHDHLLDSKSGLTTGPRKLSPLEQWEADNACAA
jgi:hypothetical protein